MGKGKLCTSLLTLMVFLAGIIAPMPECYVLRTVCPVKTSFAAERATCPGAFCPARSATCCTKAAPSVEMQKVCDQKGLKPRMKSYIPDIESAAPPAVPFAFMPCLAQPVLAINGVDLSFIVASRVSCPDPIPILLRKQSLLI